MTDTAISAGTTESVAEFAARARAWLAENMPRIDPENPPFSVRAETESWERAKELQKRLHQGGFAGICFPREYGGLGLDLSYQKAFNDECVFYEMPLILNTPSFTICGATLLDMGSESQKRDRISAAIRGEEILVQLLSEPNGGSDLAGVITRADRRDDGTWVINGAKTWSTSAFAGDYGLMLARTDWTVPKHEGLTMFLVPLDAAGITMRRIKEVNGNEEFCEEFFDGLELPADAVVGEVNDGWTVASRQLHHERRAVGGGSEFASGTGAENANEMPPDHIGLAEATGQGDDARVQDLAGRALVRRIVKKQLIDHVGTAIGNGSLPPNAGTLIRLFHAETTELEVDTALAIAGTAGVVDEGSEDDPELAGLLDIGVRYLSRQTGSLGGGTSEMARNVIGERILGFPREHAADRGVPFNQVKR
ncbi:acyl-CoA dehydrogenase family protein [Mycobacterium sp. NPDC003449]